MTAFTLTEVTDLISELEGLSTAENRTLHRQLKGLYSHGLLRPFDYRGEGPKAPALFDIYELCKARLFATLFDLKLEVKALRDIERVISQTANRRREANTVYYTDGLADALAAIREGKSCVFNLELINGVREARGGFVIDGGYPLTEDAIRILNAHDIATGTRVRLRLSIPVDELFAAILEKVEAQ